MAPRRAGRTAPPEEAKATAGTSASGAGDDWMARPAGWEILIAVLAIGLYAHTVRFGWVYDDEIEVVANVFVRSLASIPQMFTTTAWAGAGVETYLYRPLPTVTYALNHALFGLVPWSYHLVNVLLHALASVLVFRLARSWRLSTATAGIGAALFAVHPIHVEVVASVVGRKDLMAGVFTLCTLLWHRGAVARGGAGRLALPVLAYTGAMLSKEVGAVALALVAVQDWLRPAEPAGGGRGRQTGLYAAYGVALVAYLLARSAVAGGPSVPTHFLDNPLVAVGLDQRIGTALAVALFGVSLLVAPWPLSPDYSYDAIPVVRSFADPRPFVALALVALVAWGVTRSRQRATVLPLAAAWYAITIFPSSNLLFIVGTVFGERLLYLPSLAFCLVVAWGLTALAGRQQHVWIGVGVAVVSALSVQTIRYTAAWRDNLTLFRWAAASVPRSSKAHHKLGEALYRAGMPGPAMASLRRALRIAPDNEFALETMIVVREHIRRQYGGDSLAGDPAGIDAEVLYVLGQVSRANGHLDEAGRLWAAALARDPGHGESMADLGVIWLERGDTARAVDLLVRATETTADLASPWFNLGRVYLQRGDRGRAGVALQRFVRLAGRQYTREVDWARSALGTLPSP